MSEAVIKIKVRNFHVLVNEAADHFTVTLTKNADRTTTQILAGRNRFKVFCYQLFYKKKHLDAKAMACQAAKDMVEFLK